VTGSLYYDVSHNPIKAVAVMQVQPGGDQFLSLVSPVQPSANLTVNYSTGSPGSEFTVTGSNYPPNSLASVTINGRAVAEAIPVNGAGGFTFQLATVAADEGLYQITASVNPSAHARFRLDALAPLRSAEGNGESIAVPGGIAYDEFIYLPAMRR
jgi:hypothetical protein